MSNTWTTKTKPGGKSGHEAQCEINRDIRSRITASLQPYHCRLHELSVAASRQLTPRRSAPAEPCGHFPYRRSRIVGTPRSRSHIGGIHLQSRGPIGGDGPYRRVRIGGIPPHRPADHRERPPIATTPLSRCVRQSFVEKISPAHARLDEAVVRFD